MLQVKNWSTGMYTVQVGITTDGFGCVQVMIVNPAIKSSGSFFYY